MSAQCCFAVLCAAAPMHLNVWPPNINLLSCSTTSGNAPVRLVNILWILTCVWSILVQELVHQQYVGFITIGYQNLDHPQIYHLWPNRTCLRLGLIWCHLSCPSPSIFQSPKWTRPFWGRSSSHNQMGSDLLLWQLRGLVKDASSSNLCRLITRFSSWNRFRLSNVFKNIYRTVGVLMLVIKQSDKACW